MRASGPRIVLAPLVLSDASVVLKGRGECFSTVAAKVVGDGEEQGHDGRDVGHVLKAADLVERGSRQRTNRQTDAHEAIDDSAQQHVGLLVVAIGEHLSHDADHLRHVGDDHLSNEQTAEEEAHGHRRQVQIFVRGADQQQTEAHEEGVGHEGDANLHPLRYVVGTRDPDHVRQWQRREDHGLLCVVQTVVLEAKQQGRFENVVDREAQHDGVRREKKLGVCRTVSHR